jgi:hypothetical protein
VNAPSLRATTICPCRCAGGRRFDGRISLLEPYFRNDVILGGISRFSPSTSTTHGELDGVSVADLNRWDTLAPDKKQRGQRFAQPFNRDFHRRISVRGVAISADPDRDPTTGERIVLRHRNDFWAPGDVMRGDGYVDRLLFRVINNPDAALIALKAGTLDIMGLLPLQHLKQTDTPGFRKRFAKQIAFTPSYTYVGWNELRPMFRETAVRQALSRLVDRDRIISKVLFGYGEKIDSPVLDSAPNTTPT